MKKTDYIDPTVGTVGDEQSESFHGGGKTHPGACLPGGMVQLSPDTVTGGDNGTGYNYCHNSIEGFSFNHMSGIGWYGDLGNIQLMPVIGETDLRSGSNAEVPFLKGNQGWKSEFSHEKEVARGGYYSVILDRYDIKAEATVTEHSGLLRVTYPETDDARLIFNISRRIGGRADFQKVNIISNSRIEGTIVCTPKGGGFGRGDAGISYNIYFVCELSVPAEKIRFFSNENMIDDNISTYEDEDVGLLAYFGSLNEPLVVRCGISYVDLEGSRNNLKSECSSFDFDSYVKKANESWEKVMHDINVEGENETDLTLFYTCLYHTLLDPRTAADVDGRYVIDGKIFENKDYKHRTVFSGWDVYRSEFPLLALIRPDIVNDEANSLLKIASTKNTSFPKWELLGIDSNSMVGDPGLIVVSDAFLKGIKNFDVNCAYKIAKASSDCSEELFGKPFKSVRPNCVEYKEKAFVPEKLSDTLEFLLADYTMYKFAKALNKSDDAEHYLNRVKKYRENYNPVLGFMAPRFSDLDFVFENDEYDDDGTVESNIYQQSWFVPYDVIGLSELFGKERTLMLLERFFERADFTKLWNEDYNHSNEPCHNITHYFNMLGLPHRTQYWTRRVQKEAYRLGAFGFCGNEDVGQLSAWYVLSALGFAQLCPGYQAYFINTPLFRKASIRLDPDYHSCSISDILQIECDKDPLENMYIKSVIFNGNIIDRPYLTYEELTSGGLIRFELSEKPCDGFSKNIPESFFD